MKNNYDSKSYSTIITMLFIVIIIGYSWGIGLAQPRSQDNNSTDFPPQIYSPSPAPSAFGTPPCPLARPFCPQDAFCMAPSATVSPVTFAGAPKTPDSWVCPPGYTCPTPMVAPMASPEPLMNQFQQTTTTTGTTVGTIPTGTAPVNTLAAVPRRAVTTNRTLIAMSNNAYSPSRLIVKRGTVITVVNQGNQRHTLTSIDRRSFDTGLLSKGQSTRFVVTKIGEFPFYSKVNPKMKGSISVTQ